MIALLLASSRARANPSPLALDDALVDGDLDGEDLVAAPSGGRRGFVRAPGGHAWLSLVGYSHRSMTNAQEYGGFVVLGLPLDRLARPSPTPTRTSIADPKTPPPTPPPPPRPAPSSPQPSPASIVEVDTSVALTPRLARACVGMALKASGLGTDDTRIDAIVSRARWSAVLPELRLRAVRHDDERLYTDTTTSADDSRLRDSAGAQLSLEARLTWRLDRLLYADDEPSFERMRVDRQDARARIAAKVLEALFHWQRAWLALRFAEREPRASAQEEAELVLKVAEAEASLDVLTAGWFSAWRASRVVMVLPSEVRASPKDKKEAPASTGDL
ncbi:hypothetical protein [Labilithrix luteola]|nr:hypothetical protein [Labilithrix luteola]